MNQPTMKANVLPVIEYQVREQSAVAHVRAKDQINFRFPKLLPSPLFRKAGPGVMAFQPCSRFIERLGTVILCVFFAWFSGLPAASGYEPLPAQVATPEVSTSPAMGNFYRFNDITEVIQNWKSGQHLFVKGDLGPSAGELVQLEQWLHRNGPNWTVILMQSAGDQRYMNSDGRIATGMDAVELSMADLMEVGSWRSQTHAITGEQDAAVFILYLNERKFSYRASEAQSRRGLGQNRWIGKLDRPAYRAMRGGGRVLDAVRDTVDSINSALNRAIVEEQTLAAARERQRRQEVDELAATVAQTAEKQTSIELAAKAIRDARPEATGDMTAPQIAPIEQSIASLRTSLKQEDVDPASLRQRVQEVTTAADDWRNLYDEYSRFEESEQQIREQVKRLRSSAGKLSGSVDPTLGEVERELQAAREFYEQADSQFLQRLNAASHALQQSDQALAEAREAESRAAARKSLIWRTATSVGAFLSTIIAGLLLWFNRKRGPAKKRALEKFESRQQEVQREMEGVGDLLKRADIVIGDREAIERKGYQGETKALSEKALSDIDDILVMSSSVDKVLDVAKAKIQPQSLWQRIKNWFSPSGYDEGYELLETRPVEFDSTDGIVLVADEADAIAVEAGKAAQGSEASATQAHGDRNRDGEPTKVLSLNFADLFKIFRRRSDRAAATIDQVEQGWTMITSTNADLQQAIDEAYENEKLAREATEADGLLHVPEVFDELLKSAQADQDASEEQGKHDPVSAIAGHATNGLRKAANANEISLQLVDIRREQLPAIRQNAVALQECGRKVQWIDAALDDFADRARAMTLAAVSQDVASDIADWRLSFDRFTDAVAKTVRLHDQSTQEVAAAIGEATSEVVAARETISQRLNVPGEHVLVEPDHATDKMLAMATEQNFAGQASLDRGDPPAAELSIAESLEWVATTRTAVQESLRVLEELPGLQQGLSQEIETLASHSDDDQRLVDDLQQRFVDSALMIEGALPVASPEMQPDVELAEGLEVMETVGPISASALFDLMQQQRQSAHALVASSQEKWQGGRLLAADEDYQEAADLVDRSRHNQGLLRSHARRLDQMLSDNAAGLEKLQSRFDDLEEMLNRHHVTRSTQTEARELHSRFENVKRDQQVSTGRRDPFGDAEMITSINDQFDRFGDLIQVDLEMYDEASRSVRSLESLLNQAQGVAHRSQTDQIPDSNLVRSETQKFSQMSTTVSSLSSRLKLPHEDWTEIDQQADAALADLTRSVASLQRELERAREAADAIERASRGYRGALNWSGQYGIRPETRSARSRVDIAREALARGDYDRAIESSRQAEAAVANAIGQAENEISRRQAAERREAERKRRMRRAGTIGGGSIFGSSRRSGGFFGGSSGSSRRSSSRSTSRSSTSRSSSSGSGGFSRSGW